MLVGTVVALVAVAGPAFGGGIVDDPEMRALRQQRVEASSRTEPVPAAAYQFHETPPFTDVVVEDSNNAGKEFGLAIGSSFLSILYHPVRMVMGIVGAELGGVAGWTAGGDQRTAHGIWRPLVEGDYFVRPDHLDRQERFQVGNYARVPREQHTFRGPVTDAYVGTGATSVSPAAVDDAGETDVHVIY